MPEKKETPENTTPPPEVDDKAYGTFKAMLNKFIDEKKADENETPSRTKAADEAPKFDLLKSLFGGE